MPRCLISDMYCPAASWRDLSEEVEDLKPPSWPSEYVAKIRVSGAFSLESILRLCAEIGAAKVTRAPVMVTARRLASSRDGLMWPCAPNVTNRKCGLVSDFDGSLSLFIFFIFGVCNE